MILYCFQCYYSKISQLHKELRERKQKHEDTWKVDSSLKTSMQEAD